MGAGKIKFEHLGKTKDLAATPTETKDGNIAFPKPNRNPGPPPWHAPRGGSIDLSQLNSTLPAGFVLPVASPHRRQDHAAPRFCCPVGMTKGRPLMSVENMFCIRARLLAAPQPAELTGAKSPHPSKTRVFPQPVKSCPNTSLRAVTPGKLAYFREFGSVHPLSDEET